MLLHRIPLAGFCLGTLIVPALPSLPHPMVMLGLALVCGTLTLATLVATHTRSWSESQAIQRLTHYQRGLVLIFTCMLLAFFGLAIASWRSTARLNERLPHHLEGIPIEIRGVISELPQTSDYGTRITVTPDYAQTPQGEAVSLHGKLTLSWPKPPTHIQAGDHWQFTVKLKQAHGVMNPHGFDFEAWAFEQHIIGNGSVQHIPSPVRLSGPHSIMDHVNQIRDQARQRIVRILGHRDAAGILTALTVGDQNSVDPNTWLEINKTGIGHLMSISGLHITLFAILGGYIAGWLWEQAPHRLLRVPRQRVIAISGVVCAMTYALFAGFAIPAQRTIWMLLVAALALLCQRTTSPARILLHALAIVLIIDPWAGLTTGFWLSFVAVAVLIWAWPSTNTSEQTTHSPRWRLALRSWCRAQTAITLGLIPLSILFFSQISLVSPFANAIAIPWVSFVLAPLAMLGLMIPHDGVMILAAYCWDLLHVFITHCAQFSWAVMNVASPPWPMIGLSIIGTSGLLLWGVIPWPLSLVLIPGFFAPFFYSPPKPNAHEAWIDTLDVGQGLAILIRTQQHTLLYDTGPGFNQQNNAGSRIVLPFLRSEDVHHLDELILSHNDTDHTGGAEAILRAIPIDRVRHSLTADHKLSYTVQSLANTQENDTHTETDTAQIAQSILNIKQHPHKTDNILCQKHQSWDWDGVHFEIIHPDENGPTPRKTNDMSCVLAVSVAQHRVLITSDIEARTETYLCHQAASSLRSEVLFIPHHGSQTSSTPEFIQAVSPQATIVSAGYRNRYQHPRPNILARYPNIPIWRTDLDGLIHTTLSEHGTHIFGWRQTTHRWWQTH